MAIDGWHLEEAERAIILGLAGTEGTGIDPLVRAVQDNHKFELDSKIHNYTVSEGLDTGHKGGLRLAGYTKAGGGAGESAEKKAVRRAYEEAVLHALQSGDIGSFMANEIFGDMSDAEINDLVAEIEAETGMPFEDYTADILGEDAAARLDGETLTEYRQRMLIALGAEMLDEDGIKPEYEDDPLAQFIQNDRRYQELTTEIAHLKAISADQEASQEQIELTGDIAARDADAADHLGYQVDNAALKDVATVGQDEHRNDLGSSAASDLKEDGFGGFAGFANASVDGLTTQSGKLDQAALTEQFNAKSGELHQELEATLVAKADALPTTLTI